MMYNGMTFGMDGPQITGWWVNPKTGDKFKAIDSYFEDNQLIVKTADGRLLNYNHIQDYIQTSEKDVDAVVAAAKKPTNTSESLPPEILNELDNSSTDTITPDTDIYGMNTSMGNIYSNPTPPSQSTGDMSIIERALKNKQMPLVKGEIEWKDAPVKELEMLQEMLDIPIDSIIDYYISQLDVNDIMNKLKHDLKFRIYEIMEVTDTEPKNDFSDIIEEHVKVENEQAKKTPSKKKTPKK